MSDTTLINDRIFEKGSLKRNVYKNTLQAFKWLKENANELTLSAQIHVKDKTPEITIEYTEKGDFTAEMRYADDHLVFVMHTNVFQFPKNHNIMKNSYVKEDMERSYCGIIKIYNFLHDSFRYNRIEDIGYLIARIHINKDFHFFVEGKRQVGLLYNNFQQSIMDKDVMKKVLETAILYSLEFDLLSQPFENVQEISLQEIMWMKDEMRIKTGKRLGFKFKEDKV